MDKEKIRQILDDANNRYDMPVSLKGFNWGAFLLTFIWGIRYKAWITLLAIPLMWFQLPLGLNWILLLVLQLYCGIKGNEWAYRFDYNKSEYDFKMTQIKWAIFGFSLQFILPMILLFVVCLLVFKIKENPMDFAQNAQCKVAYDKLQKGLSGVNIQGSENAIAQQFAKKFKDANAVENSVNFFLEASSPIDLYYIKFEKPDGEICSLSSQNCKIESGFVLPPEAFETINECVFYFDNYKTIFPTEQTKINIQKGYNIFKYL